MNKHVVVYKQLAAPLMARLRAAARVTLIDDVKGQALPPCGMPCPPPMDYWAPA